MFIDTNNFNLMELLQELSNHNITKFSDVKTYLESDKFKLIVKEDKLQPNLYLVTYDKTKSVMDNDVVKVCRGIILEKETNKIISYSFNGSVKDDDFKILDGLDIKNCRIERAIDGTQIRLSFYKNRWLCSTTRCISALRAKFYSNLSFYELFEEASEGLDYSRLDTNYCYSFVLCHPKNRIVVNYEKPSIVHVLTRNLTTFEEVDADIGVLKPEVVEFASFDEFKTKLTDDVNDETKDCETKEEVDAEAEVDAEVGAETDEGSVINKISYEGYIVKMADNTRMKYKTEKYRKVKELRGNTNNFVYKYFDLRKSNKLHDYLEYYPEKLSSFNRIGNNFNKMATNIHREYGKRFIRHECLFNDLTWQFKPFISSLHTKYLDTKVPTTLPSVHVELMKLHPAQLCFMYNKTYGRRQ